MTDEDLIARLRDACRGGDGCKCSLSEAADRIAALVKDKERLGREVNMARYGQPDFAWSMHKQAMTDLQARAERLEAALREIARIVPKHPAGEIANAALTPTAVDASQAADPAVNAPDPACDHCGMDPAAIREAALEEAALEQALSNFRATLRTMPESKNLIDDLIPKGAAE